VAVFVVALVLAYPLFVADYPKTAYHRAHATELHRFLRGTPKDSVTASVSSLADDVPTFAARAVLVSPHYALPFHRGYYEVLRERMADLLAAQYTADARELDAVIDRWSIDFWLLDSGFEKPSYLRSNWLRQFEPASSRARAFLERGGVPLMATLEGCAAVEGSGYRLLDARCMIAVIRSAPSPVAADL
jgi:hypothetical protein